MTGRKKKDLLIIIPAYNEEKNIVKVINDIRDLGMEEYADLLVLNDASSDRTPFVVAEMGVKVMSNIYNMGYGSTLQVGYKYAIRRGYSYVIQMDADGQHDPCNIKPIYEKLKSSDVDIVLGSRFLDGAKSFHISGVKKFAIGLFKTVIYLFTKQKLTDPTSGLQGISRRTALYYSKYGNFDDRYPDANILLQMLLQGYRVEEIPAIMHERTVGKSMHSGLAPIMYMIRMFFSIVSVILRYGVFRRNHQVENE